MEHHQSFSWKCVTVFQTWSANTCDTQLDHFSFKMCLCLDAINCTYNVVKRMEQFCHITLGLTPSPVSIVGEFRTCLLIKSQVCEQFCISLCMLCDRPFKKWFQFKQLLCGTVVPGFHSISLIKSFYLHTKAVLDNSYLNLKPFEFMTKLTKQI